MANFIQGMHMKKGALHEQLGISEGKKIPRTILVRIKSAKEGSKIKVGGRSITVTGTLKKRASLATTLEHMH